MKAEGEEYEDEHNKPHLVYRHEMKTRSPPSQPSQPTEPCAASGNRLTSPNHSLSGVKVPPPTHTLTSLWPALQLVATAVKTALTANYPQPRSLAAGLARRFEPWLTGVIGILDLIKQKCVPASPGVFTHVFWEHSHLRVVSEQKKKRIAS